MLKVSKDTFTRFAVVFAVGIIAVNNVAIADQPTPKTAEHVTYSSFGEAGRVAADYALTNDGIGIVLVYGTYDGAPNPHAVGQKFQEVFEAEGEASQYFILEIGKAGYAVFFEYGRTGTEPMPLREAATSIEKWVSEKKYEREVFKNAKLK